jgi:hypothetical protein
MMLVLAACSARAPQPVLGNHAGVADTRPGAIEGAIRDAQDGEPLAGVTLVISRPRQGPVGSAVITDERGRYRLGDLASGTYIVTIYYSDFQLEITDVTIHAATSTRLDKRIDPRMSGGALRERCCIP